MLNAYTHLRAIEKSILSITGRAEVTITASCRWGDLDPEKLILILCPITSRSLRIWLLVCLIPKSTNLLAQLLPRHIWRAPARARVRAGAAPDTRRHTRRTEWGPTHTSRSGTWVREHAAPSVRPRGSPWNMPAPSKREGSTSERLFRNGYGNWHANNGALYCAAIIVAILKPLQK